MKKIAALMLLVVMLVSLVAARAETLGVQVIGGKSDFETLSLDDMVLMESYKIDGYAKIKPTSFQWYDCFAQYNKGAKGDIDVTWGTSNTSTSSDRVYDGRSATIMGYPVYYKNIQWIDTGSSADLAIITLEITNLQKRSVDFSKDVIVTVYYGDDYQFGGFVRQYNPDYNTKIIRCANSSDGDANKADYPFAVYPTPVIHPDDTEEIAPIYTGIYLFGCVVPNAAIDDKAPIRIVIELGGNELTYNIRK